MNLKKIEEDYRLGLAFCVSLLIIGVSIAIMLTPTQDVPTARGVTLAIDQGTVFCPSGGSAEVRVWDNTGGDLWDSVSTLTVPIAPDAIRLDRGVINGTVFCRTGSGTYQGYVSPTLAASVGSSAESVGVHTYINGEERPAFICWDTVAPHTSPEYHRIQLRADDTAEPVECFTGTDQGSRSP